MTKEEFLSSISGNLKEKGMIVLEDTIENIIISFHEVTTNYIKSSPSKVDDMGLPFIEIAFNFAEKQADKIDGVIGNH